MIRRLEERDAALMLEWMHDESVNCWFRYPFADVTLEKAKIFIKYSFDEENQHFAITDKTDAYLGTVSLKHISEKDHNAELVIAARKKTWNIVTAERAVTDILHYAFDDLGLHRVYLTVLADNVEARKFYESCGFDLEGEFRDAVRIQDRYRNMVWYAMLNWKEKSV